MLNVDLTRRNYIRIILAGYRISFYKNVLTLKRCRNYNKKVDISESIRYLLDNKNDFKSFINNEVEIYRRTAIKNNDCFMFEILKEFRINKDYLIIVAVDMFSEKDVEIICFKKKYSFKKFHRFNDTSFNKKLVDEKLNIKKYFPEMEVYDGKGI